MENQSKAKTPMTAIDAIAALIEGLASAWEDKSINDWMGLNIGKVSQLQTQDMICLLRECADVLRATKKKEKCPV